MHKNTMWLALALVFSLVGVATADDALVTYSDVAEEEAAWVDACDDAMWVCAWDLEPCEPEDGCYEEETSCDAGGDCDGGIALDDEGLDVEIEDCWNECGTQRRRRRRKSRERHDGTETESSSNGTPQDSGGTMPVDESGTEEMPAEAGEEMAMDESPAVEEPTEESDTLMTQENAGLSQTGRNLDNYEGLVGLDAQDIKDRVRGEGQYENDPEDWADVGAGHFAAVAQANGDIGNTEGHGMHGIDPQLDPRVASLGDHLARGLASDLATAFPGHTFDGIIMVNTFPTVTGDGPGYGITTAQARAQLDGINRVTRVGSEMYVNANDNFRALLSMGGWQQSEGNPHHWTRVR